VKAEIREWVDDLGWYITLLVWAYLACAYFTDWFLFDAPWLTTVRWWLFLKV
jgi:hypothetical protein